MRISLLLVAILYGGYLGWLFTVQRSIIYPGAVTRVSASPPVAPGIEVARLQTESGQIETLFLPAFHVRTTIERSPTLIFAHGNGEVVDPWVTMLDGFRERGLNVLLVEYPGYGRSTGTTSEASVRAAFLAAYDHLVADPRVDSAKIIGYGQSLGGGAICLLARDRALAAIILQSTFTSLSMFTQRYLAPSFLLRDRYDNVAALRSFSGPVLIIQGRSDKVIPWQTADALAAVAKRHTVRLYECGHWCWYPDRLPFWRDVDDFLRQANIVPGASLGA